MIPSLGFCSAVRLLWEEPAYDRRSVPRWRLHSTCFFMLIFGFEPLPSFLLPVHHTFSQPLD